MQFGTTGPVLSPCVMDCDSAGGDLLYLTYAILIYLGIVITISFLITLGFYLVYKHKKDDNPWKHAIRRSWPWWIIVFLLPFVVLGILSLFN